MRAPSIFRPSGSPLPFCRRRRSSLLLLGPSFSLLVVFALLCLIAPVIGLAAGPLAVSADGRRFVDAQGVPFFVNGDSAWSLFVQPTLEEARLFLDDRASLDMNFLVVNLIEHEFGSQAPANVAGDPPFTGAPFATPNEAYFAHADTVLTLAAERGIHVLLGPVYLGWQCGDEGWCAEIQAAGPAVMRQWGRYLGQRYRDFDNLLWMIGGDADPAPVVTELREFVAGLREFDDRHLLTAHNHRGTFGSTYWPGEPWLQFDTVFTFGGALYEDTQEVYAKQPVMPFLLLEGHYEHEKSATLQDLRAQSYWTVLSGGAGVVFGNCPMWHFGSTWNPCLQIDWKRELSSPGAIEMRWSRRLFESRRWAQLVPDSTGALWVSGQGASGSEDYALAAVAADGSSILAYLPSPRAIALDTSSLAGDTVRAWWYDPTDASATAIGEFAKGTLSLPLGPAGDQVLVIDDATQGFAPPGTPLPVATAVGPSAPASRSGVRLQQNRPNPFNPRTEIRFVLSAATDVWLVIVDVRGRRVRRLFTGPLDAGEHRLLWDGRDEGGRSVGGGVYFYELRTADSVQRRRMVLLR